MIIEGLKILTVGMSMVFIILSLLVLSISTSAKLIRKLDSRKDNEHPSVPIGIKSNVNDGNEKLAAVISSAISKFKQGK